MFLWVKTFGDSELAMRFANLPLFGIICISILLAPMSARLRLIWLLIIALHAFVWYYLNEARPYLMLLAGSALFCVASMGLFRYADPATFGSTAYFRFDVILPRVDPNGRQ